MSFLGKISKHVEVNNTINERGNAQEVIIFYIVFIGNSYNNN
jgi:hypothetical protein